MGLATKFSTEPEIRKVLKMNTNRFNVSSLKVLILFRFPVYCDCWHYNWDGMREQTSQGEKGRKIPHFHFEIVCIL